MPLPCAARGHLSSWRLSLVSLCVLASCSGMPMQVDPSARAPSLDGYGGADLAVTTRAAQARRLFGQGMAQAYASNEGEAVRMFKAALAIDPGSALCARGVAWQLGPNINAPDRGDLAEARRYVDLAVRLRSSAGSGERELIDAMALRYARPAAIAAGPGQAGA